MFTKNKNKIKQSRGETIFECIIMFVLAIIMLVVLFPLLYLVSGSLASARELALTKFLIIPKEPTLDAYRYVFGTSTFVRSLGVTAFVTIAGTFVNLVMTSLMAYPLSRRELPGRRPLMIMVTITLVFGGGMIPTYLVVNGLGLIDTYWSLIIPGAISSFNLILIKNFFQEIPESLIDAAKIDGCSEMRTLWSIVLPLSKPAMATFTMFYAVGHWNTFMTALLYLNDPKKWTIQVLLRQIIFLSQGGLGEDAGQGIEAIVPPQSVKMAVIVVATLPIIIFYPFMQKYFDKGVMMGSVKG